MMSGGFKVIRPGAPFFVVPDPNGCFVSDDFGFVGWRWHVAPYYLVTRRAIESSWDECVSVDAVFVFTVLDCGFFDPIALNHGLFLRVWWFSLVSHHKSVVSAKPGFAQHFVLEVAMTCFACFRRCISPFITFALRYTPYRSLFPNRIRGARAFVDLICVVHELFFPTRLRFAIAFAVGAANFCTRERRDCVNAVSHNHDTRVRGRVGGVILALRIHCQKFAEQAMGKRRRVGKILGRMNCTQHLFSGVRRELGVTGADGSCLDSHSRAVREISQNETQPDFGAVSVAALTHNKGKIQ